MSLLISDLGISGEEMTGNATLAVTMRADRPPHRDRPGVQVHVVPRQGPRFLGSHAGQQAQHDVRVQPRVLRRLQQRRRLLQSERLRRPARPAVRSSVHQRETFRRTRSLPSAWRRARVRQLCAFCSVGVEWVTAIFASAPRTSCTVRSRSGIRPMTASTGAERIGVDLDRLGGPARQSLGQPVGNRHVHRVARSGPDARVQLRVQRLELVLDLGPGLAADLLRIRFPSAA
jgi:hypothetical protein